jgi:hypothetical protein
VSSCCCSSLVSSGGGDFGRRLPSCFKGIGFLLFSIDLPPHISQSAMPEPLHIEHVIAVAICNVRGGEKKCLREGRKGYR